MLVAQMSVVAKLPKSSRSLCHVTIHTDDALITDTGGCIPKGANKGWREPWGGICVG